MLRPLKSQSRTKIRSQHAVWFIDVFGGSIIGSVYELGEEVNAFAVKHAP